MSFPHGHCSYCELWAPLLAVVVALILLGLEGCSGFAVLSGWSAEAEKADVAEFYSKQSKETIQAALDRANRNWERIEARLHAIEEALGINPDESIAKMRTAIK